MGITLRDADVLQQAFMVSKESVDDYVRDRRKTSRATNKWTDSTLGGNYYINPPPQFTPTADIRVSRHWNDQFGGMGRCYSDHIDDNADIVYLRFGMTEYVGLLHFYTNMFDASASYIARNGRMPGYLFKSAELFASIVHWPLQAVAVTYTTAKWFMGIPRTKYCYLKQAMPLYWLAANNMLNTIMINMNMIPPAFRTKHAQDKQATYDYEEWTDADRGLYAQRFPETWSRDGHIDLFYVANRATRKQIRWQKHLDEALKSATDHNSAAKTIQDETNNWVELGDGVHAGEGASDGSLSDYIKRYLDSGLGTSEGVEDGHIEQAGQGNPDTDGDLGSSTVTAGDVSVSIDVEKPANSYFDQIQEQFESELRDGGGFLGIKVDHNGTIGESFSNSAKEPEIKSKINGMSSAAQEARFTFQNGNTGIGFIDSAVKAVGDVANGFLSGATIGGIANILVGQGFIDVPDTWDSSSCDLPRESYTVKLRSPYGHPVARCQNLIVPLVCILTGGLPHAAGGSSHTVPFMCELYSKGRNQIRYGMIDSIRVERGVGNIGWTRDKQPLGIDVTFSVLDLEKVMAMPIADQLNAGDFTNPAAATAKLLADDSHYTDYTSVLAGLGLSEQIYRSDRLARIIAKGVVDVSGWFQPNRVGSFAGSDISGQIMSAFVEGTAR